MNRMRVALAARAAWPSMMRGAAILAGLTTWGAPAAAKDAMLGNAVGICETALWQGDPDIAMLAATLGFQRATLPNGGPAWVQEAGADRTIIASVPTHCAIGLYRGNYASGATAALQAWARAADIGFSAVPNGDKFAEKGGYTYRYRELPQTGSGQLLISRR